MKRLILLLLLPLLLFSCTPQKRLARLLRHHPELVKTDSSKVHSTVHENGFDLDTNFWISFKPAKSKDSIAGGITKPDSGNWSGVEHVFHYSDSFTGVKADIFQYGAKLNLKLHKKAKEIPVNVTVPVKRVVTTMGGQLTTGVVTGVVIVVILILVLLFLKLKR